MITRSRKPQFGDRVRVVPETGKVIRDERTGKILPPAGMLVIYSTFWARRVAEQSVLVDFEAAPPDGTTLAPPQDVIITDS